MTGNKPEIIVGMPNDTMLALTNQRSRMQVRNAIEIALIVMGVAGAAHVALGSNPIVPAFAILTMALAMLPFVRYGVMNITAILLSLVAFRYVGFPLFGKLIMGQALDTNLDQPVVAYTAVLLGVVAYLGAVFLANRINVGTPLLKPLTEPRILRRLSYAAFVVGCIANLDMSLHAYTESDAVTYSNFFASSMHLALIGSTAAVILRSDGRRIFDSWTLIILATEVVFAFATNVRTPILEAFLCLVITAAAFRGNFSRKQIAGGLAALLLLVALTPVLLFVRGSREDLTMSERVGATVEALMNWEVAQSAFVDAMEHENLSSGYFLTYYGAPNNIFERFSHVNDVDVLISGADNTGTLGFEVLDQAFERALPRFIAPDKPLGYGEGDWIYCVFRVKCLYGNYLTASLLGTGYAAFGWVGVVAFPFMLGLPLLLLIKKAVGFNMVGNVWVVYMLVTVNNSLVEGGASTYIAMLFRQLPQDLVVMLVFASLVGATRIVLK